MILPNTSAASRTSPFVELIKSLEHSKANVLQDLFLVTLKLPRVEQTQASLPVKSLCLGHLHDWAVCTSASFTRLGPWRGFFSIFISGPSLLSESCVSQEPWQHGVCTAFPSLEAAWGSEVSPVRRRHPGVLGTCEGVWEGVSEVRDLGVRPPVGILTAEAWWILPFLICY